MSILSYESMKQLLDQLASDYNRLMQNREELRSDCNKLREFIDNQVQQIQSLSSDFEKLHQEFIAKGGEDAMRAQEEPEEDRRESDEQGTQEYEFTRLVSPESIRKPLLIQLIAEIVDLSVICATTFSPNNNCIAIGSDKNLRIYNIDKDEFQFQRELGSDSEDDINHIQSISWYPDSSALVCSGEDGHIRIFNTNDSSLRKDIEIKDAEIAQVEVSKSGDFMAAIVNMQNLSSVVLFQLDDFSEMCKFVRNEGTVDQSSLALSPDDRYAAVSYGDFCVAIWDIEKRAIVAEKKCHTDKIHDIKFISATRFATASLDSTIKIWDISTDADGGVSIDLWKSVEGHENYVLTLAVDKKGEWLLSGSKDLTTRLTDLETGEMIYSIKSHTNSIISVDFNAQGTHFCTGSGDKSVKIWSFQREEIEETM